ncbi:MAG: SPOR domain-containing protein [Tannerella sp.]|nr:SPOR domain-containing protein [Tannerella sp.]
MNRLIGHIERLLFQHDCVIIPEFGGFVLQTVPAVYIGGEHSFFPAHKEIVFNPTLVHNDGLLVEAYMQSNSTDFDKAQNQLRKDVAAMKEYLDEDAEFQMGAIGVFIKEDERLVYMPGANSDNRFSVSSFGLPVFHFLPLSARKTTNRQNSNRNVPMYPYDDDDSSRQGKRPHGGVIYNIPVTRTFLRSIAAAAAAVLLFLLFSPPVSDVNKTYPASFIPQEIIFPKYADEIVNDAFNKPDLKVEDTNVKVEDTNIAETKTVETVETAEAKTSETKPATTSTSTSTDKTTEAAKSTSTTAKPNSTTAKSNSTTKTSESAVASSTPAVNKPYYIIIGSFTSRTQARNYMKTLKGDVAKTAGIVVNGGKVRVYAQQFESESPAQSYMQQIRQNSKHAQAWLYVSP